MKLTVVPQEQVAARSAARWGDFGQDEPLFDLIRAEVTARGSCPRWTALHRLEQALGDDDADQSRVRLRELCDGLEYEGDLTASSGGVLNVSPVRAIELQPGVHRMVCSLPSRRLRASLPGELHVDGLRRLHRFDPNTAPEVAAALQALGGVVVSPQAWAGLDLTPVADGAWLDSLDQRLEWRPEAAGSLERDGALDWQALTFTADGPRWRRNSDEPTRLWRARTSYGRWIWAWVTADGTPSTKAFVTLIADDANRTLFALAREAEQPVSASVVRDDAMVHLRLREWLPRAEYRYLSVLSDKITRYDGFTDWMLRVSEISDLIQFIQARLGIIFEGEGIAESSLLRSEAEEQPTNPENTSDLLDAKFPQSLIPSLVERLLDQLGVTTYHDVLQLDLIKISSMRGVGRKKLDALRELQSRVQARLPAEWLSDPIAIESQEFDVHESTWRVSPYDSWPVYEVIGRHAPPRIPRVIADEGIETFEGLRRWCVETDPTAVNNYGSVTHQKLAELIERIETEGYESLHFEGELPGSVEALAQRYLSSFSGRTREIFEQRFVGAQTLEEIGTVFELTRERIRQIVDKELCLDKPTWGKRAEELLDPMIQILEECGGVALTSTVEVILKSAPRWCLNLCMALAGLEPLVDVIPGVSTTYMRDDFNALRRLANEELDARLDVSSDAKEVYDVFDALEIKGKRSELNELARYMFNIEIDGDRAFLGGRAVHNLYLRVVYEAGGPLTADEVASRAEQIDPTALASAKNAARHLGRSSQVFHYDHGLWIHQKHLQISRDKLDSVARQCEPSIRAAGGEAVSVRHLLDELIAVGDAPASLNAYTLRDAILQLGNVRCWRAGVDVAWLDGEVSRQTIEEWIAEVAPELEQPFTSSELVDEVAGQSGNLASSIYAQLFQSSAIMYVGGRELVANAAFFESITEMEQLIDLIVSLLPPNGVISSLKLVELHPALRTVAKRLDHRLLWGLGWKGDRIATKARGFFLWQEELGERFWDIFGPQTSNAYPLIRASSLSDWIELQTGWGGDSTTAASLLQEGVKEGWFRRIGLGWYISNQISFKEQIAAMDSEPQVVRLAMGSQDFIRESPARELLNEIRSQRGLFRVPAG